MILKVELNKDWWGYDADVCGGTALADADAGFKSMASNRLQKVLPVYLQFRQVTHQLWSVPTESVDTLKGDSNVSVGMGDSIAVWYFFMNTQTPGSTMLRFVEAMAYAINKEHISRSL